MIQNKEETNVTQAKKKNFYKFIKILNSVLFISKLYIVQKVQYYGNHGAPNKRFFLLSG